jgi:hypothetical protein
MGTGTVSFSFFSLSILTLFIEFSSAFQASWFSSGNFANTAFFIAGGG